MKKKPITPPMNAPLETNDRTLDDGFGNIWHKCERSDCGMEVVRPGKVQCTKEPCGAPMSDYPGCVYCMEAGTPVESGEFCPRCLDRSPLR